MTEVPEWWRGGVIYQIYPRSFVDSNGDGIGDLRGITGRLDHVAGLGVDAIWISPFFTSPMKDFGYDIADYRGVDPMFGTLDDFSELVNTAHSLGLKVIIDQVLSHSSDQHPWFEASRQSRDNDKSDWYVWADPKPDGSPPNNWLSIFGGSAWSWESRRRQYYLHNFLDSQPDMDFHNPEVRAAQLDNLRFWLDLGVDGFRLDVVNYYFHSRGLEDNPPRPANEAPLSGLTLDNPYAYQRHVYDIDRPENIALLREIRGLMNRYGDIATMGEITGEDPIGTLAEYTGGGDKLNMAYTFSLLTDDASPEHIRSVIAALEERVGDGWPCWALSNHDVTRCVSRWGGDTPQTDRLARVAVALIGCLRGSVCLYQGDELGLPQADVPYDRIRDPYGLPFWPEYKGRDGCRTPMVWTADATGHGGFSRAEPWLPIDPGHLDMSVDVQRQDTDSTLKFVSGFLAWRRQQPALVHGSLELLDSGDILAWTREANGQILLSAFNLLPEERRFAGGWTNARVVETGLDGRIEGGSIVLPGYGGLIAELS